MSCEDLKTPCCGETEVLQTAAKTSTQKTQADFSFCLPFNGKVVCSNGIISVTQPKPPADGVYNTVTISSGCITALGTQEVPSTVASPCAPIPTPCDCDGTGSTAVSTQSGNLTKLDATGNVYTSISYKAGTGIKITGNGTTSSPLTISASTTASKVFELNSANAAITVTGSGTSSSPYTIKHKESSSAQNINGMSFDKFGHLTSYSAPSTSTFIKGIVGANGISSETASNGIATISLEKPIHPINGGRVLGGYNVVFDDYNRVTNITRQITLTAGTYLFGTASVSINAYGSITAIAGIDTDEIVGTHVVQLTSLTSNWSHNVKLGHSSYLLITIDTPGQAGNLSVDSLTIDGTAVSGSICGINRYVCLSSASYAKGSHTLVIKGNIPTRSYITITLTSR